MPILHRQPADHIHESRGSAPRVWRNDVEHRREDVGVVETLEESPARQRRNDETYRLCQATDDDERCAAQHADRLHGHSPARRAPPPPVRQPSASRRPNHAGELHEDGCRQSGRRQSQAETIVEELRHPREEHDRHEVRAHERAEQAGNVGVRQTMRANVANPSGSTRTEREPASTSRRRGQARRAPVSGRTQRDTKRAEDNERQPPAIHSPISPAKKAAANRAHVDRGLVQPQRPRAGACHGSR